MPGILVTENRGKKDSNGSCADGQLEEQSVKEKVITTDAVSSQVNCSVEISVVEDGQLKESEETVSEKGLPRTDSPTDSEANLSLSTNSSTSEVDDKPPSKEEEGAAKTGGEKSKPSPADENGIINVHVIIPGVSQPVDVMLTPKDTVHELLQFALERPECCYRTSLSVRHNGKRLDDFYEISAIEDLQDWDTLELVEEPYTQRDVRIHIQRLIDLLSTNPLQQAISGLEGLSLSFLSTVAQTDLDEGRPGEELIDSSKLEPPPYILPQGSTNQNIPLSQFYPQNLQKHMKFPECLKSICYSAWNPPPSRRKMKGDLLYLEITTLEGQEYFITAVPTGFYLNKSSSRENFDPTPRKVSHHHKHLVGLLFQISPLFKKHFAQLQKFGDNRHAFEVLPAPYPVIPWLAPKQEHKPINFRIDDSMGLRVAQDEMVLGHHRDWNEEFQVAREIPTDTPTMKAFRDKTLFKVHSDFALSAMRGAMAVVDGCLIPLNPGDEKKFRMYMWNNIFFSLAFDGRDHYSIFGGDEAAHAAAAADLRGVAEYEKLNPKGLYTLGSVIVDYRGYRVVCQTIIPGLLQRDQESAVVYGSIDTGKNIKAHDKFKELLSLTATDLHTRTHKVRTEKNEVVELSSSLEVKGIIGNDGRHYVLDLFRVFPPDANYMDNNSSKFRHKMAVLRPEFMETYLSFKFMLFLKLVREKTSGLELPSSVEKKSTDQTTATTKEEEAVKKEEDDSVDESSNVIVSTRDSNDGAVGGAVDGAINELIKTLSTVEDRQSGNHSNDKEAVQSTDEQGSQPSVALSPSLAAVSNDSSTSMATHNLPAAKHIHRLSNNVTSLTSSQNGFVHSPSKDAIGKSTDTTSSSKSEDEAIIDETCHLLMEGKHLTEEKHVGSEIPFNEDLSKLPALTEDRQLDKELDSALEGHPQLTAAIKEAAMEAGSCSNDEFVVQFNMDLLSPQVDHADSKEDLDRDHKLVTEAGNFLYMDLIVQFVRDCIQLTITPTDGESLKRVMHTRGINMRYLGRIAHVATMREESPAQDLHHLKCLCISEMIVRIAKRQFRKILQQTATELTSDAIAHFLNCFLSDNQSKEMSDEVATNGHSKKKNKKKKTVRGKVPAHLKMSPTSLWNDIITEVEWYYKFKLEYTSLDELCSKTNLQKLSLLRELCRKTGVQLVLKEYDFSVHSTFTDDDVNCVYPIVKHTNFRPAEIVSLFEMAQSKLSAGNLKAAGELFAEVIQMFIQIYGPLHVDIANCYKHVARIYYLLNEPFSALTNQHKATLIFERVLGVDHPDTVAAYINLALHCHNNKQTAAALRLLYRARYLLKLLYGEDHPEMATCDSNIAIILHAIEDHKNALVFLESALSLHEKYYGTESLQTALTRHLLARVQSFMGDFRAALSHEKITYSIYKKKLGDSHDKTSESSLCLKDLTEKAVTMQKTINEMTAKGSGGRVLLDLPGSWGEVVGMVNGVEPRHVQKSKPHVVRKRKKHGTKAHPTTTEQ